MVASTCDVLEELKVEAAEEVAGESEPNTALAALISVHPTNTPLVLFMGIAKHCVPLVHFSIAKFPAVLHFATLPAIQAISPPVHGDEKFSCENRLL